MLGSTSFCSPQHRHKLLTGNIKAPTVSLTPPPPTQPPTAPDRTPAVTPTEQPAPQAPTNPPNPRRAESRRASDAYGNPFA
ncbi:hypothetical protein GNF10_35715 [Nostoc sp. UCD121]|uniref:hypothetical protein n=1 Tax=Nostoc sp. UCD121 TaxID=2681305 RepID=UPI001624B970|nr:hypothetical protein [Nostoc sp. UCD121]MBC1281132.1 hypothetical protein [Nostoc sp. UCD121]